MTESIKDVVGRNIVRLRKRAGLTQRELGKAVGTTGNAVYLWEKGVTWPEADKFDQMAKILKIPATEFFVPLAGSNHLPPTDEFILAAVAERFGFHPSRLKRKK